MNKRGTSILMVIFEVLVVSLMIYLIVSIASSYGQSDTITKIKTAEEMRLMINTLVGISGDAIVKYPQDLSKFSLILNSNTITVFKKEELPNLWVIRDFILPQGSSAEGAVEEVNWACLEKAGAKIILRECAANE